MTFSTMYRVRGCAPPLTAFRFDASFRSLAHDAKGRTMAMPSPHFGR